MPKKPKEENKLNLETTLKKTENKLSTRTRKTPVSKKLVTKSTESKGQKISKKSSNTPKNSTRKISSKNEISKSNAIKSFEDVKLKKHIAKKTTSKKTTGTVSARTRKTKKSIEILEYYDLPYRYNKTVIKLLAQTPTSLFVYWEISDDDREIFLSKYGKKFFSETKPVLLIHNETMNYTFEVEINDFANCWYLHVNDAKCLYNIELGRKYINIYENKTNDYIYVTSSNTLEAPNDHILFNNINHMIYFKNVKTNKKIEKKISDIISIRKIGQIYNIYDLYKKIYTKETIEEFDLKNPSSSFIN